MGGGAKLRLPAPGGSLAHHPMQKIALLQAGLKARDYHGPQ